MEKYYQDQLERIDRLLEIINAKDPYSFIGQLQFEDIVIFTCQCIWHLKDWILNDVGFGAKDYNLLNKDIHSDCKRADHRPFDFCCR